MLVTETFYIAVVGSGPSGFYAAERLLKQQANCTVHMFEQLPTPYGLLRGGVAPDHQKMKSVASAYERIANHENFHFFGGLCIGKDISVDQLKHHYTAVVFANGANSDRKLNIPGETLPGSHTATEFVGWYNAHPHFQDRHFNFNIQNIAIIGQGNVAIDVARILSKTKEELASSDISLKALDAITAHRFKTIYVIGRRGPLQAAFTELEIKELGQLEAAQPYINPEELKLSEEEESLLNNSPKLQRKYAILKSYTQKPEANKTILHIKFLRSPVELEGKSKISQIKLEKNHLLYEDERVQAKGSGTFESLNVDLVFRSIGYKGSPIPGLVFDEKRGIIPNEKGRVLFKGQIHKGLYATGWIKRGPSGVIGTNRKDSFETIDALLEDLETLEKPTQNPDTLFKNLKSEHKTWLSFDDWKKIDALEQQKGKEYGKVRLKFDSIETMLNALKQASI